MKPRMYLLATTAATLATFWLIAAAPLRVS